MIGEVLNQSNSVSEAAHKLSGNFDPMTYPKGRNCFCCFEHFDLYMLISKIVLQINHCLDF